MKQKSISAFGIIKESAQFTFRNSIVLIKLCILPLALSIGIDFAEQFWNIKTLNFFYWTVDFFLIVFITALWVPQWIQYYNSRIFKSKFLQFEGIQFKFLIYNIILAMPSYFFISVLAIKLPWWGMASLIIILTTALVVFCRFYFILPAVSLSHKTSLITSWMQSMNCKKNLYLLNGSFLFILCLSSVIFFLGVRVIVANFWNYSELIWWRVEQCGSLVIKPFFFLIEAIFYLSITKLYKHVRSH